MWNGRSDYKEREQEKYDDWKNSTETLDFPVYIMHGSFFWLKETIDRMSDSLGRRPDRISSDLDKYTERMRYKSLARKKHFIWFESKTNTIKESDMKALREYLGNPSNNGILFISLKDRKEKFNFLKRFKAIRSSRNVKLYEMEYVSDYFKTLYVQEKFTEYGFDFESEKLRKNTIRNLILNMEELEDNLLTLKSLETPVFSSEDIKSTIEEYSDLNTSKLYDSLAKLNRKNVPYKILNELIEEGVKPQQIMRGIQNHFHYLYQAKYLKLKGITRANDVEEETKEVYKDEGLIFSNNNDIWELSRRRRNKYLEDCDDITLKEIIAVQNIINSNIDRISYREGDKVIRRDIIDKQVLFKTVIEIMDRLDD